MADIYYWLKYKFPVEILQKLANKKKLNDEQELKSLWGYAIEDVNTEQARNQLRYF